jgi:hypothetical protein
VKLHVAIRLGRVSNLPTVTSNVLAAVALAAGATASIWTLGAVCLAMSMMYTAGMFLNDAFDRDIDRVERPERPIPSGQVAAAHVFDVGFVMLGGGILTIAVIGAGWAPIVTSVALGAAIIFYDAYHKQNRFAPLVMGLCRAGVYATAALVVRDDLCPAVWLGIGALIAYLIGLTYVARFENLRSFGSVWPLAFLALPFALALPKTWLSGVLYVGLFVWIIRALGLIARGRIRESVGSLIAGISLLDALWIARTGDTKMALVAVGCFVLTNLLQRIVPGT